MQVKVLGSGCSKCQSTIGTIERVARESDVDVQVVKLQDRKQIRQHGVTATPAVAIDGRVMHSGGVPARAAVQARASWLQALATLCWPPAWPVNASKCNAWLPGWPSAASCCPG